jgi:SP family myo-inositol transporter-like MFS transporter 13
MAVGGASFVVPLYIAELAPAGFRGRLVTMNVIFITLGQVVAYVVGWVLGEYGAEGTAWRWMVGLGALPAVVQAVVMVAMPETPRWLVMVGRVGEARAVVERVLGKGGQRREVVATVKGIEVEVREEAEGRRLRSNRRGVARAGWMDSAEELFGVRRNRRALAIACLLQGLQQLCGFVSATAVSVCGQNANPVHRTRSCTFRLPSSRCSASRSRHSPRWSWLSPTLPSPSPPSS